MTRRLVLIRHAKAAQSGPSDAERSLAPRGLADAAAIGRWLTSQDVVPDRVVVSPARRTRQTWEVAGAALDAPAEFDERIYDNTVGDLLEIIGETPDDVQTLVLVGHNPAMGSLAAHLDPQIREFPTSATAVFDVDGWVAPAGELVAYAAPRG